MCIFKDTLWYNDNMSSINSLWLVDTRWNASQAFDVEYIYGFVGWGGLQTKSMTSQRNRAVKDGGYVLLWQRYDNNKMADKCY